MGGGKGKGGGQGNKGRNSKASSQAQKTAKSTKKAKQLSKKQKIKPKAIRSQGPGMTAQEAHKAGYRGWSTFGSQYSLGNIGDPGSPSYGKGTDSQMAAAKAHLGTLNAKKNTFKSNFRNVASKIGDFTKSFIGGDVSQYGFNDPGLSISTASNFNDRSTPLGATAGFISDTASNLFSGIGQGVKGIANWSNYSGLTSPTGLSNTSTLGKIGLTSNPIGNWYNKGRLFNEANISARNLFRNDLAQYGQKVFNPNQGFKLSNWDVTRGFRPGVPGSEGGFMSGPTPLTRQLGERVLGAVPFGAIAFNQGREGSELNQIADATIPKINPYSSTENINATAATEAQERGPLTSVFGVGLPEFGISEYMGINSPDRTKKTDIGANLVRSIANSSFVNNINTLGLGELNTRLDPNQRRINPSDKRLTGQEQGAFRNLMSNVLSNEGIGGDIGRWGLKTIGNLSDGFDVSDVLHKGFDPIPRGGVIPTSLQHLQNYVGAQNLATIAREGADVSGALDDSKITWSEFPGIAQSTIANLKDKDSKSYASAKFLSDASKVFGGALREKTPGEVLKRAVGSAFGYDERGRPRGSSGVTTKDLRINQLAPALRSAGDQRAQETSASLTSWLDTQATNRQEYTDELARLQTGRTDTAKQIADYEKEYGKDPELAGILGTWDTAMKDVEKQQSDFDAAQRSALVQYQQQQDSYDRPMTWGVRGLENLARSPKEAFGRRERAKRKTTTPAPTISNLAATWGAPMTLNV